MTLSSPYEYPRPFSIHASRLSSELTHTSLDEFAAINPEMSSQPFIRNYAGNRANSHLAMANPLDEILAYSRKQISAFELKLPFTRANPASTNVDAVTAIANSAESIGTVQKNSLLKMLPNFEQNTKDDITSSNSLEKESLIQSTQQPQQEADDFESDPLACHANNIVRMAMDTTMMGSFCNSSISLNFLNLEESIHRLEGSERSRFGAKKGALLNLQKATRIEISAADLEEAINNPIK